MSEPTWAKPWTLVEANDKATLPEIVGDGDSGFWKFLINVVNEREELIFRYESDWLCSRIIV